MEMRRLDDVFVVAVALMLALLPPPAVADGGWTEAHATFYGDETGAETMRKQIILTPASARVSHQ
jgi:hypothetical protein